MQCEICKNEVDEESLCEICGVAICSVHSELSDDYLTCHYCLGKEEAVLQERDEEDFAGTEM